MTGLFGGTFDPPHLGHLAVAEACADAAGLDRVVWMPAATSPHKRARAQTRPELRLAMVEAATQGNDRFETSDLEIQRDGVSYTVDTVRQLARAGGLALVIGGDSLASFETWRAPREIARLARLVVYRRPGDSVRLGSLPGWLAEAVTVVDGPPLDLSSTALRARVAAGQTVRYLVPDGVRAIIAQERLYREGG